LLRHGRARECGRKDGCSGENFGFGHG
jgi:hypothetical protein